MKGGLLIILNIIIGFCLSAACGFRIFIPLLAMCIANLIGIYDLPSNLALAGSYTTLIILSIATFVEVVAYFVPFLDNILDTIATPISVIAGFLVMYSCLYDITPALRWALSLIVGGGFSAFVQILTVVIRGLLSGLTIGIGNFVLASIELIVSIILSLLALLIPFLALAFVIIIVMTLIKKRNSLAKTY